jgi:PTH1 family peptidyl-tRNA hydrolase
MRLIVGLGNPGDKYRGTRHNIGFQVLDYLAEQSGLQFSGSKWQAKVLKTMLWGESLVLVKPETFMNNSGLAVGMISSYYRVASKDVIAVHDDLDLDLGRVKLVVNRGAGGHNGIASLIQHLGDKEFSRLRVGIGRPPGKMPASDFVLGRFNSTEREIFAEKIPEICSDLRLIVEEGALSAMGLINRK